MISGAHSARDATTQRTDRRMEMDQKTTKLRAALYARYSTAERRRESIAAQQATCASTITAHSLTMSRAVRGPRE
jgi:hypothetical protein